MLDANEAIIKPSTMPNNAPEAMVRIAAPGKDNAVTATYNAKKPPMTNTGDSWRSWLNCSIEPLRPSSVSNWFKLKWKNNPTSVAAIISNTIFFNMFYSLKMNAAMSGWH